jgi:polysaccharide chain length determinant protein (PEP-CTERM system associated)
MNDHRDQYARLPEIPGGPAGEPPALNPGDILRIAERRRWSIFLGFAVVFAITAAVALLLPPVYRASATILIEEQEIPADFVTATVTSFAEQRLQQINQRIMSTTRLIEVIEQFDLYKQMRAKKTNEEVIDQMRADVKLRQISAEVMDRRTGRPTTATIAFSLAYQGKDSPATIQKVTNVLVSLFLEENLQVRERQTAETSKFLEDEMRRVQEELALVEKRLSDFKEQHINDLPELLQLNIQQLGNTERSIERMEEQLRSQKTQEGYLQTQLANISPFLENTDRGQLRLLETELATLRARFSEAHPDVIKTDGAVKALRAKIAAKADGPVDPMEPDNPAYITLSSQLAAAQSELSSLVNQIAEQKRVRKQYERRLEATPKVEREYRLLTAEQANLKTKSDDLMHKVMEAKVAQGLEKGQKGERFTLIDPPRLPERPFKPNRMAIVLIGLVLGIGAGVGWAALREFSDRSVHDAATLASGTGLPVLGEIPAIVTRRERSRIRIRRMVSASATCLIIVAGLIVFHFWVMDLNVFWAKLGRRLPI